MLDLILNPLPNRGPSRTFVTVLFPQTQPHWLCPRQRSVLDLASQATFQA